MPVGRKCISRSRTRATPKSWPLRWRPKRRPTIQAGRPNGPSIWTARRWQRWPLRFQCRRRVQNHLQQDLSLPKILSGWPTCSVGRHSQSHPPDQSGKSSLGCAAYPRRVAQARYRGRLVECRQVHGATMRATVTKLEDLPSQSRPRHRCYRSIRCADHRLQAAVWPGDYPPRATPPDLDQRHNQPDGGMDRLPDHRSLPPGNRRPVTSSATETIPMAP